MYLNGFYFQGTFVDLLLTMNSNSISCVMNGSTSKPSILKEFHMNLVIILVLESKNKYLLMYSRVQLRILKVKKPKKM